MNNPLNYANLVADQWNLITIIYHHLTPINDALEQMQNICMYTILSKLPLYLLLTSVLKREKYIWLPSKWGAIKALISKMLFSNQFKQGCLKEDDKLLKGCTDIDEAGQQRKKVIVQQHATQHGSLHRVHSAVNYIYMAGLQTIFKKFSQCLDNSNKFEVS